MISLYPNVHVYRMPNGGHDAFCRACRTAALIFDDGSLKRFKKRHEQCRATNNKSGE